MEHLRCVVERITYQNEENGYTVLKCAVKTIVIWVTVVGTMPDTHVGSVLSLEGFWKWMPNTAGSFVWNGLKKHFLPLYMALKISWVRSCQRDRACFCKKDRGKIR